MTDTPAPIKHRHDFVFLFDVEDGNPNGDPDAGNLPRTDPETGHGLVTDVCLKRKVRNQVALAKAGVPGFGIFVQEKAILNVLIEEGYQAAGIDLQADPPGGKRKTKGEGQGKEVDAARTTMCRTYFDVRTFGAVMSTGANAGQVRGPVQLTFARSVHPVLTLEHTITRMAVATEKEAEKQSGDNRTMGRKNTLPYGLYRAHGFVSPAYARTTGFSDADLTLFFDALLNMFEHDRSAARGLMTARALVVFKHLDDAGLGSASARSLFDRVTTRQVNTPARAYGDFEILLDGKALAQGRTNVSVS